MASCSPQIDISSNAQVESTLFASPSEERFSVSNLTSNQVSVLEDTGPFLMFILSSWDNILGPILKHVWLRDTGGSSVEDCVTYVVSRTLSGELLRDAPENIVDSKLFILKEKEMICHSFIFTGRDKSGSNISSFSMVTPYLSFKTYLPLVDLMEERCKLLIAKLRVLLTKDLSSAYSRFLTYLQNFINTMISLKTSGLPREIQLGETALGSVTQDCSGIFNKVFMLRAITSHLQTFGSTVVVGSSLEIVNLMISSLGVLLSADERCTSRYAVKRHDNNSMGYEPDLFLQGLLKDESGKFVLPVKDIVTSAHPTTLIDVDSFEVKQTCMYHEHSIKRKEFLDDMLALIWENQEETPEYSVMDMFHDVQDIGTLVQTFMNDLSLLPAVDDIRQSFIQNFQRIIDRKALAFIKYLEAKTCKGTKPFDNAAKRQLRHDLQLTTEADFYIVLVRAEKHKPGIYVFYMGDPRQSEARLQLILESL